MKKYSFKLQTLLRIREIHEEEAERNFRLAVQELTLAVERLDKLKGEYARLREDLASLQRRGIDVSVQLIYDQYFLRLRQRVSDQLEAVNSAEEEVELRREELIERMKDRKTIEKLRMRDFDRYLAELRRFEQVVIDDLATLHSAGGVEASLETAQH